MMNETYAKVTIPSNLSKIILVNAYCFSVVFNSTLFHFQKCDLDDNLYIKLSMKHPKKTGHKPQLGS